MQRAISSFFFDPHDPPAHNLPGVWVDNGKHKLSEHRFANEKAEKPPNSKEFPLQGSSKEDRASVQPSTCYEEIRAAVGVGI